jgi:tRNA(fMet)-specific endonuclease VapC
MSQAKRASPRGAHDLIIATTAAATARSVVTHDKQAAFTHLPGVRTADITT